jgi:uncharacterized protein (DUF4415 family)
MATTNRRPRGRPRHTETVKQSITIRLSPDVIRYFQHPQRAGWQSRIDETLLKHVQQQQSHQSA